MTLTTRERQIAELVASGLTNKEIARELGLSPATIKEHVHWILRKLGLARRSGVGYALVRAESNAARDWALELEGR